MIILRFFLLLFNAAIITFLIYKIVDMIKRPAEKSIKRVFIIGGILLLFAPLGIFFRFFGASPQYFIIYPIAIFLFLYFTKQLEW